MFLYLYRALYIVSFSYFYCKDDLRLGKYFLYLLCQFQVEDKTMVMDLKYEQQNRANYI